MKGTAPQNPEPPVAIEGTAPATEGGLGLFGGCLVLILVVSLLSIVYDIARLIKTIIGIRMYLAGLREGFFRAVQASKGFLMPIALALAVLALLLLIAGLIALVAILASAAARKGRASVFISYHHSAWIHADGLAEALSRKGLRSLIVRFQSGREHDDLLDSIYSKIEQADFVICLPGLRPSFVEHEVSATIAMRKPLFILLPSTHAGAPNTAQHSYPVLALERLVETEFEPLIALIQYLHGNAKATLRLLLTPTRLPPFAQGVGTAVGMTLGGIAFAYIIGTIVRTFWQYLLLNIHVGGYVAGFTLGIASVAFPSWLLLMTAGVTTLRGLVVIRNRTMAVRHIRRLIIDGEYSYPVLYDLFRPTRGLLKLLRPFFRHSPPAYHERVNEGEPMASGAEP